MSLFNSISRGFGMGLGSQAAKKVTSTPIDSTFSFVWKFFKWCMIITFVIGLLQGIFGK